MNRDHILLQDFRLETAFPPTYPDPRFTGNTLEELYLAVCKGGYEFRHFERIGRDAGAKMYTPGVRECTIESGRLALQERVDIDFETFRARTIELLRTIAEHVRMLPLVGAEIRLAAVWPTEKRTDLREVFGLKFVNIQREQLEVLDTRIENTGIRIHCSNRASEGSVQHLHFDLAPDMSDHHQLRVALTGHYHELMEDVSEIDGLMQQVSGFLKERIGCFVESLAME